MIDSIEIKNFKSIVDLKVDLGRFNIVIGENGCGKTNFLEAFSFASSAIQYNMSNDVLGSKIRMTPKQFILPAFDDTSNNNYVQIKVTEPGKLNNLVICTYDSENNKWINIGETGDDFRSVAILNNLRERNPDLFSSIIESDIESHKDYVEQFKKDLQEENVQQIHKKAPRLLDKYNRIFFGNSSLKDFVIFSPEETKLRQFSDEAQILPLGRKGEGLFQYLKFLSKEKETELIRKIIDGLFLLDWFKDLEIPDDLLSSDPNINISDRYINKTLRYFDQRSTNEGFLYLLFYLTLFQSNITPSCFAIDNIENSFNPKLCKKLISLLNQLSLENNKQVILTTHNPFVLDGLDIKDDSQRLFVTRRDVNGHTVINRITNKGDMKMKLSEAWMKGFFGGLPENF